MMFKIVEASDNFAERMYLESKKIHSDLIESVNNIADYYEAWELIGQLEVTISAAFSYFERRRWLTKTTEDINNELIYMTNDIEIITEEMDMLDGK